MKFTLKDVMLVVLVAVVVSWAFELGKLEQSKVDAKYIEAADNVVRKLLSSISGATKEIKDAETVLRKAGCR